MYINTDTNSCTSSDYVKTLLSKYAWPTKYEFSKIKILVNVT